MKKFLFDIYISALQIAIRKGNIDIFQLLLNSKKIEFENKSVHFLSFFI